MEVYRRITERVRGSLWAHHRRLMPERQFHRILAYVYNNKYEYQVRFDQMEVVGTEWGGRVEVVTTPAGYLKRIRVNPCVEDLPRPARKQLLLSAYGKACAEGRRIMQEAELRVYKQFLNDLKPIVQGIRDNPEFFTVSDGSIETIGGALKSGGSEMSHRTIPFEQAFQPSHEHQRRQRIHAAYLSSPDGRNWARTMAGKKYLAKNLAAGATEAYSAQSNHSATTTSTPLAKVSHQLAAARRPRGAPGAKTDSTPLELLAPYTPMDEGRLLRKNWMSYLDNKHVAETMWTRAKIADREKSLRLLQEKGHAWHRPVHKEAAERW
jgi:DNA-binding protein YbaB